MNTHFNPVSKAVFSGRNLEAVEAAKAEHGYNSNRWITYFQAKELDLLDGVNLKGKAVGMIRFSKKNGKSTPVWYNVFNLDLFPAASAAGLAKNKAPKAKKAAKAAPKKAAKAAPKKAAPKKATLSVPEMKDTGVAIPCAGSDTDFIIKYANGTFERISL